MQGHISVSVLQEVMVLGMIYNMSIYLINSRIKSNIWQDEWHPKRIKTVYKTGQKTAMTQHIGLGSSTSQNAFVWKGVPSPSFWSILTPVLSCLIYILYEKFQVLFVLQWVNGFKQYASTLPHVCSRYTVEMAASNVHWYLEGCLW